MLKLTDNHSGRLLVSAGSTVTDFLLLDSVLDVILQRRVGALNEVTPRRSALGFDLNGEERCPVGYRHDQIRTAFTPV